MSINTNNAQQMSNITPRHVMLFCLCEKVHKEAANEGFLANTVELL